MKLLTRKDVNVGCMDESGSCMDESVGCMDKKELSNEEFISYFKRLSKDDKIAAFDQLFERFKNARKEREKVKSDYDKTVFVLDSLRLLDDY